MSTNTDNFDTSLVIREATDADRDALLALAQRDSRDLPSGLLLVAETGDEVRAAIALDSASVIADPFYPTTELIALLRARRSQLTGARRRRRRIAARTPLAGVRATG